MIVFRKEFYNNVSAKEKVQDQNLNQIKLKLNDSYENDEIISSSSDTSNDGDAISKTYLDTNLTKTECQVTSIEEDYNDFIFFSKNNLWKRF